MTFLDSRSNQVVLGVAAAWNTAPGSFNKSIAHLQSWGPKVDRSSSFPIRAIGRKNGQVIAKTVGIQRVAGTVSAYLTPADPTTQEFLAAIMATNAVSGSTFFTHTFTGKRLVPAYGFGANVSPGGVQAKTKNQLGLFISAYKITKSSANEPIMCSVDLIGVSEGANNTAVETYSPTTVGVFEGRKAKVEIKTGENALTGMTEILVKNFELTIPTGAEFGEGGQSDYLTRIQQQINNQISFSWENDETNSATVEDFFKNNTRVSVQITLDHDTEAYTGTTYQVVIQLPSCYIMREPNDIGNENPISEKYTLMAAAPTTGSITDEIKITTKDATSGTIAA